MSATNAAMSLGGEPGRAELGCDLRRGQRCRLHRSQRVDVAPESRVGLGGVDRGVEAADDVTGEVVGGELPLPCRCLERDRFELARAASVATWRVGWRCSRRRCDATATTSWRRPARSSPPSSATCSMSTSMIGPLQQRGGARRSSCRRRSPRARRRSTTTDRSGSPPGAGSDAGTSSTRRPSTTSPRRRRRRLSVVVRRGCLTSTRV